MSRVFDKYFFDMSKIYNTKTPLLKATMAYIRVLDAKNIKVNGYKIEDLWGFSCLSDAITSYGIIHK